MEAAETGEFTEAGEQLLDWALILLNLTNMDADRETDDGDDEVIPWDQVAYVWGRAEPELRQIVCSVARS